MFFNRFVFYVILIVYKCRYNTMHTYHRLKEFKAIVRTLIPFLTILFCNCTQIIISIEINFTLNVI